MRLRRHAIFYVFVALDAASGRIKCYKYIFYLLSAPQVQEAEEYP